MEVESLDEWEEKIRTWIGEALGDVEVISEAPSSKIKKTCVSLYAMGLENLMYQYSASRKRPPLGFLLRYLLTTWGASSIHAQEMLSELVFSAMGEAGFEVELTQVDPLLWQALGVIPRPSFFLLVPICRERQEPQAPRVRQPPRVELSMGVPWTGRLIGPGSVPLMNATIEIVSLDLACRTDADGRFRFPLVPGDSRVLELRIEAGGTRRNLVVDQPLGASKPSLILFEP